MLLPLKLHPKFLVSTNLTKSDLKLSPSYILLPPTNHPNKLLLFPLILTVSLYTKQFFILTPFLTTSPNIPPAYG